MDFLNNIWNLLTTENLMITNIVTAPFCFIEAYLTFKLFTILLKINYTKKQQRIYIITISLSSIFCSLILPYPISTYINYISLFILIKLLFKKNILKTLAIMIMPVIIFALVNSLIMNPFLKIFNTTFEHTSITPIYQIIYLILVYIIVYGVTKLLEKNPISYLLQTTIDQTGKKIIRFNLIAAFLVLCIQGFLTVYYINIVPIIFTLFNFILLLSYYLASFYSLSRLIKLHKTKLELENAESYNNSLTILYDNVRGFKHDFNNMVNSLGGYIQTNDIEGLKKFYSGLEKHCQKVNNVGILNPNIINNPGIYNLIVSKYQKANNLDIKINFEIFFDFNELKMPIYEFSIILGILLDNAIEASKECDEKTINLLFRESRKNNVQIISIENTYNDKNIDTKKIFEKGISGKKEHTGLGLWEVNEIVKKNNNIILKTSKDETFFKQQLEIYY